MALDPKFYDTLASILVKLADPNEGTSDNARRGLVSKLKGAGVDIRDMRLHHVNHPPAGKAEDKLIASLEKSLSKAHADNERVQDLLQLSLDENQRLQGLLTKLRSERYARREKELREAQREIKRLTEDTQKRIIELEAQVAALAPQPDPWVHEIKMWLAQFTDWRVASFTLLIAACGLSERQHDAAAFARLRRVMASSFPEWHETTNVPLAGRRVRGYLRLRRQP